MADLRLAGCIDHVNGGVLSGWAADGAAPGSTPIVTIQVNGVKVGVATFHSVRKDAVAAGYPGARALSFDLRPHLKIGQNQIDVVFERAQMLLGNGRWQIHVQAQHERIGDHWSGVYRKPETPLKTRWWQCEHIVRHINKRVCGEALSDTSAGLHKLALDRFAGQVPFGRGVSIGSGAGHKERAAIECGLVEHFTLYELSSAAVEMGREEAAKAGLAERMEFRLEDGFQREQTEDIYDLVYWNNALHHMFDVQAAIAWSRRVLKPRGVFLMDDFVGPNRMEWSARLLQINTDARKSMPPEYLRDPSNPERFLPAEIAPTDPARVAAIDPSECADSSRILPELLRAFPDAWVKKTGGGIYHLALNDVLHNILAREDFALLDRLLQLDDECADLGETHYAVAIAVK